MQADIENPPILVPDCLASVALNIIWQCIVYKDRTKII